jgi:hypothetical protein
MTGCGISFSVQESGLQFKKFSFHHEMSSDGVSVSLEKPLCRKRMKSAD